MFKEGSFDNFSISLCKKPVIFVKEIGLAKKLRFKRTDEYAEWEDSLANPIKAEIIVTIAEIAKTGIFPVNMVKRLKGDGHGLYELRFFFGPGYRVYFCQIGKIVYLLLNGGTKKTQDADIDHAQEIKKRELARRENEIKPFWDSWLCVAGIQA